MRLVLSCIDAGQHATQSMLHLFCLTLAVLINKATMHKPLSLCCRSFIQHSQTGLLPGKDT